MTNLIKNIMLKLTKKNFLYIFLYVIILTTIFPTKSYCNKIGFVNTDLILRASNPAKEAQAKLDAEFKPRETRVQSLQKNAQILAANLQRDRATLSQTEGLKRERAVNRAEQQFDNEARALRDDFAAKQNDLLQNIIQAANISIKKIAESENYDLIIQDAVTVNPRVDITDKVIQYLGY